MEDDVSSLFNGIRIYFSFIQVVAPSAPSASPHCGLCQDSGTNAPGEKITSNVLQRVPRFVSLGAGTTESRGD